MNLTNAIAEVTWVIKVISKSLSGKFGHLKKRSFSGLKDLISLSSNFFDVRCPQAVSMDKQDQGSKMFIHCKGYCQNIEGREEFRTCLADCHNALHISNILMCCKLRYIFWDALLDGVGVRPMTTALLKVTQVFSLGKLK
jgi:hypothetical protein